MSKFFRYPLQVFNYAVFMALVWFFSIYPSYQQLDEDQALLTFTMSHIGKHVTECKKVSYEELMKLPPNMRKPTDCPRERSAVNMELTLDDEVIFKNIAYPLGLYKDQGIDIYENIKIPVGSHRIKVWMNDDVKVDGPTHILEEDVEITYQQHLVVQFNSAGNSFTIN